MLTTATTLISAMKPALFSERCGVTSAENNVGSAGEELLSFMRLHYTGCMARKTIPKPAQKAAAKKMATPKVAPKKAATAEPAAADASLLFTRARKVLLFAFSDIITAALPIGLFFGRIANFINGELFGRPTQVSWAMVFPNGGPLPRHPSQLYEAGLEGIVLFTILAVMIRMGALKRPGLILGSFITIYGFARITSEFFREPDPQLGFLWGGLTMGMLLSVPMIIAGAIIIVVAWRRKPQN